MTSFDASGGLALPRLLRERRCRRFATDKLVAFDAVVDENLGIEPIWTGERDERSESEKERVYRFERRKGIMRGATGRPDSTPAAGPRDWTTGTRQRRGT